jgi:hypothetical protein
MGIVVCPACGGEDTRSAAHRWTDLSHRLMGQVARRCRTCRNRFYVPAEPPGDKKSGAARKHKHGARRRLTTRERTWLIQIALFLGMLLIFYVFLRYITQEHSSGDSGAVNDVSNARAMTS